MRIGWLLVAALTLCLSGCTLVVDKRLEDEGDGGGTECSTHDECGGGQFCVRDECRDLSCTESGDCPCRASCADVGVCRPADFRTGGFCTTADGESGACIDGTGCVAR